MARKNKDREIQKLAGANSHVVHPEALSSVVLHHTDPAEQILAIGAQASRRLKAPCLDHAALLYDENGLPK